MSDSGARGPGFETYRRRVVSLSKTLYSPKVLVNYPGSDGSVPTCLKIVDWDVKPQHNQLVNNFSVMSGRSHRFLGNFVKSSEVWLMQKNGHPTLLACGTKDRVHRFKQQQ